MNTTTKPLRADAERNRLSIICAAGAVFAAEGTDVTLERIAQAAGVGVGTIYRRFPTVDDLVAVVLEEKMRLYADLTEAAAERAQEEPWEAFRECVMILLEQQAADLAFSDVLLSAQSVSDLFDSEVRRAFKASVHIINTAREAGAIRPDFRHSDLLMLQHANAGLVRGTHESAPEAWRRFADYMLQSFRTNVGPLADPPAAWMSAEASLPKDLINESRPSS